MSGKTAATSVNNEEFAAIVLAAGKSTRMRSKLPKALHPVCGKPILAHILDTLAGAGVSRRVLVVGHEAETVRTMLDNRYGAETLQYAEQIVQKGTGHATQMAEPLLAAHKGVVLVLPGDTPLLTSDSLRRLLETHATYGASATLLTAILPQDAGSYGRVLRDAEGLVTGIVEARDATPEQLAVREINTSVYAFSAPSLFRALRDLRPDNAQGELYLTDVIKLMRQAGETVAAEIASDPDIVLGVNTRVELAEINVKMRARLLQELMLSGVTITDPATTYVEVGVTVGQDTTILPNTHLTGATQIGEDCVIGPNAVVSNTVIGDRVLLRASFADQAVIGDDSKVGPFAHLRPGTKLGKSVRIGNFVETKAATLEDGVSASHLTYLGDASIGAKTNIGAGTITCNYDGYQKSRTEIGSNTFIGTNSTLVAPITVGNDAFTAAGSVITESIPDGAFAIARQRQTVKEGWVQARRERQQKAKAASEDSAQAEKGEGSGRQ
jgi:bifunctional UDP-N-acetylglucosamine pyrophosphorylase/glucosamine-1-phosphate N-acetyltransferase